MRAALDAPRGKGVDRPQNGHNQSRPVTRWQGERKALQPAQRGSGASKASNVGGECTRPGVTTTPIGAPSWPAASGLVGR
jgi:hypothetical protein